jgi:hypothetical protein
MAMIDISPGKYFISHSYKDAEVRDHMLTLLPEDIEPFIFPPITVTPQEFVSSSLIQGILDCNGMIVFNEGSSAKSFWVAFERDYALRSNKNVFMYTPSENRFEFYPQSPLDLAVFLSYASSTNDKTIVDNILNFMRSERFFDV